MRALLSGHAVGVAICYRGSFGDLVGAVARCTWVHMLVGGMSIGAEFIQLLCVLVVGLGMLMRVGAWSYGGACRVRSSCCAAYMVVSRLLRVQPALLALSFGMRDLLFG
jgi:hypothetical protein